MENPVAKLINPTLQAKRQSVVDFLAHAVPSVAEEATDGLNDLVHATTETGKGGEMTIKIKMRPIGGKAGQMEIEAEVKTKLPQPTRGKTILFATADNNLQRTDPRQQTLDGVRDVNQESVAQQGGVRTVAPEAKQALRAVTH
ncbi:hypothetical protein C8E08_3948 [Paracidovorax citrulli]|uniref:Uncharacterized protein n=1 Tax=Paracidovorax citrulli (strain AAC00-1) TaxID=397945 RepID=A1TMZ3_PARC0|nr:hypothetical protein Aave_1744 [Paracidovorax citrulli AAC00-1]ATG94652.1 hypothetical protein CQB05_11960 [Paracidovorax citrulli]PVY66539.1 hypothetical protein C8E08_3948 [Paracidovorax citrulli]REG69292.1 hypothetical protein C8E07_2439 [Paracidovorax citrulli]RLJ93847.1 hypothetical protein C8E06_2439 [Paracidovorax citrulli]